MHWAFSIGDFYPGEPRLLHIMQPDNQPLNKLPSAVPVTPRSSEDKIKDLEKDNKELKDKITSMEEAKKIQAETIASLTKRLEPLPRMENGKVVVPGCEQYQPYAPQACRCGWEFYNPRTDKRIRRVLRDCAKNYNYQPVRREPEDGAYRTRYNRTDGMHYEQYHSRGDGTGYWTKEGHVVDKASGIPLDSVANIQLAQQIRQDRFDADRAMRAERSRALSQFIHDSHRQGQAIVRRKSEVYNAGLAYGVDWSQPRGIPNPEFGGHMDRMNARGGVTYPYGVDRFAQGPAAPLTGRRRQGGGSWMDFGPQSDPAEQAKIGERNLARLRSKFDGMLDKFNEYEKTYGDTPAYKQMQEWLDVYKITKDRENPNFPGTSELDFLKQFETMLESFNKGGQVRKSIKESVDANAGKTPFYLELNTLADISDLQVIIQPIEDGGTRGSGVTYHPLKRELMDDKMSVENQRKYGISFEHSNFYLEGFRTGHEGEKKPKGINIKFGQKGVYEVRIKATQAGRVVERKHLIHVNEQKNPTELKGIEIPEPSKPDTNPGSEKRESPRQRPPRRFRQAPEEPRRRPNANDNPGIA